MRDAGVVMRYPNRPPDAVFRAKLYRGGRSDACCVWCDIRDDGWICFRADEACLVRERVCVTYDALCDVSGDVLKCVAITALLSTRCYARST